MANKSALFKIDIIMVDGKALAFEDASAMIDGVAGFENETVLAASGDDGTLRKRVPRLMKAKILFNDLVDPQALARTSGVQIVLRDSNSGRKCVANTCVFKSMGSVGNGAVDIEFNLLSPLQWV
jgi:hypothetical protein